MGKSWSLSFPRGAPEGLHVPINGFPRFVSWLFAVGRDAPHPVQPSRFMRVHLAADLLLGHFGGRSETRGRHLIQQTLAHLTGDWIVRPVRQVEAADNDFARSDPALHDEGERARCDPIVNDTNNRLETAWQKVQPQRSRARDQIPPLPVAVIVGRERRCLSGIAGFSVDYWQIEFRRRRLPVIDKLQTGV